MIEVILILTISQKLSNCKGGKVKNYIAVDQLEERIKRRMIPGDIVTHFKYHDTTEDDVLNKYIYKIIGSASHTETGEKLMIYQQMYAPFKLYARPYDMFMDEVDKENYPEAKQKYRFEKISKEMMNELAHEKEE